MATMAWPCMYQKGMFLVQYFHGLNRQLEGNDCYTSQLSILCEMHCCMVDDIVSFVMKASVQSMAGYQVLSPQS